MRRAIIVTDSARKSDILRYEAYHILVLEEALPLVDGLSNIEVLKEETTNAAVDATLVMPIEAKSFMEKLKQAIEMLWHKGFDELTILCSVHQSSALLLQIITLFNLYPRLKLSVCDDVEEMALYHTGTYILTKNTYNDFDVFPYPLAVISIDHVQEKYTHVEIGRQLPFIQGVRIIDRLCVLRVESGTAIVIQKEAKPHA